MKNFLYGNIKPHDLMIIDREAAFQALPEVIQRRYNDDPHVRMWVGAYLYCRITEEEMYKGLCEALTLKCELYQRAMDRVPWLEIERKEF